MFNPDTALASTYVPSLETAARSLKVVPTIAAVHNDAEIEAAIIALGREPGGGVVVVPDAFTTPHRVRPPETTYRRSIGNLSLPETAVYSPTESTR